MSESTPILSLPLIQPNQAQKHVTHNEALQALDALVQPVVIDLDLTAPPSVPVDGDCHLVAAGATGDWTGQDNALAVQSSGGWMFYAPRSGWKVYVQSENADFIFDGVEWLDAAAGDPETLGINTGADSTNRFAVSAPASLLTHEGAGHQLKINKASAAETNSLLFQTNWSGRAEMGCAGSDDFAIKVSDDGATFRDGLIVDAATGVVRFPSGMAGTGSSAGVLGGQTIVLVGERNGELTVGSYLAFGNGGTTTAGPVLPFSAKVHAATVSIAAGPAGITTFDLSLDKASDPLFQITLDYSGSDVGTAIADFSAAPRSVAAGTAISLIAANTVGASKIVAAIYLTFD